MEQTNKQTHSNKQASKQPHASALSHKHTHTHTHTHTRTPKPANARKGTPATAQTHPRAARAHTHTHTLAPKGAQTNNQPTNQTNKQFTSLRAISTLHTHELTTCVNSSMVFEWLGAYDCSTSFALRAISTCLCVKLHLSASRSRELKNRFR